MKHYLLIFCLLLSISAFSQENGFKIRVHDKTHLSTKGEYAKKVLFPSKYKKLSNISYITLNLYLNCPEKGCSDWDYSISVLLRTTEKGDTVNYQLGRMITPYSGAYNQGDNAKTWNPSWSWDVSNYLLLLKDSVDIVVIYEGYQDGFLATTDFEFDLNKRRYRNRTIKAQNIHYGYFPYGNIEKPIDNYVTPKEIVLPKGTKIVYARVTISGHGGDSTNAAAEFLKKEFYYKVNGETIATQAIWKDDCGCNPIQPQGGTWIYNRAGWCPGTKVNEYIYDLTPYIKGNKATVDIDFEYYKTLQIEQPGYQVAHDIFFLDGKDKIKLPEGTKIEMSHYLPNKFVLTYKTNNDATRNKAFIIEKYTQNKAYERTQLDNNKEYNETIELKEGYYNFLFTDSDCDGLSWWANREQGNGYVYIYNEDKTKLLEAFEPDFGCKIDYEFFTDDSQIPFAHNVSKLIKVPDTKAKTYTFVVFLKDGVEEELVLEIKNRKTKEVISKTTYPKADRFQIVYDYSVLPKGSYDARVSTKTWSETRAFSIKD